MDAATVQRTNANSHIVWQILHGETKLVFSGPPEFYEGMRISGRIGWRTKREATAALEELRALASNDQVEARGEAASRSNR